MNKKEEIDKIAFDMQNEVHAQIDWCIVEDKRKILQVKEYQDYMNSVLLNKLAELQYQINQLNQRLAFTLPNHLNK